ncbi:MAG: hypothetical protein IT436_18740 [Phycisphaerales bacterium]|nr:hypothetical protein [Phycisphaerales bacterium]
MRLQLVSGTALIMAVVGLARADSQYSWRYYRPSNTGIQGDYNEALYIGADGDPWIAGYDASFEEGGIAKFIKAQNRWINISNVDYPEIGHPEDTGTSRVSDIIADASGTLWMATGRGALKFNPDAGPVSLARYDSTNSLMPGGWCEDVDLAPDGTLWFASRSVFWGGGGLNRYNPATDVWTYWATALGDRISVQPKPGGGYYVWNADRYNGSAQRFDSATQTWAPLPDTGAAGEVAGLPGKTCTDAAGNFWALRRSAPGEYHHLDYRRPDGAWVVVPPPYTGATFDTWAFRAFGDRQALLVDGGNTTWRFDGASWQNLGQWRPGSFSYAADIDAAGNVWVSGVGGAARRDVVTGQWQRYRVTNTSQYDFFNNDLSIDPAGGIYACANAGPGFGGMVRFDGKRWIGFNNDHYGLGHDWPFPTDNSEAVFVRPSTGRTVVNPMYNGVHEWNGTSFTPLLSSATVKDFTEDSFGRLWFVGEYFDLRVREGATWRQLGITAWGGSIDPDPDRPGTIWAATGHEITRTDGSYRFSRFIDDFPELTTQSDTFSGLAVDRNGIAWIGATVQYGAGGTGGSLIRIDSNTGEYRMLRHEAGWPLPGQYVSPLAVTPDGKVWMQHDSDFLVAQRGLCWYDGVNVGVFPAPPGGEPQWGGLPHAGITDLDVKLIPGGYELWMSCASRGIAVLSVTSSCAADLTGDGLVDFADYLEFLNLYDAQDPRADFNGDGLVDFSDYLEFLNLYDAGC